MGSNNQKGLADETGDTVFGIRYVKRRHEGRKEAGNGHKKRPRGDLPREVFQAVFHVRPGHQHQAKRFFPLTLFCPSVTGCVSNEREGRKAIWLQSFPAFNPLKTGLPLFKAKTDFHPGTGIGINPAPGFPSRLFRPVSPMRAILHSVLGARQ